MYVLHGSFFVQAIEFVCQIFYGITLQNMNIKSISDLNWFPLENKYNRKNTILTQKKNEVNVKCGRA